MVGPAELEIRRARQDELADVAALYWRTWHETQAPLEPPEVGESRPLAFFMRRATGWAEPPLAAYADSTLVGFAAFRGPYVIAVFVDPAERGRGVGALLMGAAEASIGKADHPVATLDCIVGNDAGRRFYERCGWKVEREFDDLVTYEGRTISVRSWHMTKRLT
jgi:GNAT superfamily N-acetyltransferase